MTNSIYGKKMHSPLETINSDVRDNFQRITQMRIDRFTCTLLAVPEFYPRPVIDIEPGEYFAARIYNTKNGVECGARAKPMFFTTEKGREAFITNKVRAFQAYQSKRNRSYNQCI